MHRILKIISLIILFGFHYITFAAPFSHELPIHITADSSTVNYKTGVTTYEGHVNIEQGTSRLQADKVVTQIAQHKLQEAIAYGIYKAAVYNTIPRTGDLPLQAKAKIIKLYPLLSTVMLEGDVLVTQGESTLKALLLFTI